MSHMTDDLELMTTAERDAILEDNENRRPVAQPIPQGTYEGQFIKANIRVEETEILKSGKRNPFYGLETAGLQYNLFDVPDASGFGTRTASGWINLAQVQRRQESGIPEPASRNYAFVTKALGLGAVPLTDVVAKAVDGPRFRFVVGKKGYIDKIEAA